MKKLFGKKNPVQSQQPAYSTRPTPFSVGGGPDDNATNEKWQLILTPSDNDLSDPSTLIHQQQHQGRLASPHSPRMISGKNVSSPTNIVPIPPSGKPPKSTMGRKPPPSSNPPSAAGALGILRSLEPQNPPSQVTLESFGHTSTHSLESQHQHQQPSSQPQKKQLFWNREDKKQKQSSGNPPLHSSNEEGELTKMIGYLTATASEDWPLLYEVCDRASNSEHNAKEAVRALRREFKYGAPSGQLAAIRIFAFFLRNSAALVVSQLTSSKFLDTLEELIVSPRTLPSVRARALDVIAAAAYASSSSKRDKDGFRGLWKKVKPHDMPDEGVPFNGSDPMFNPPNPNPLPPLDDNNSPHLRSTYELHQPPHPLPVGIDEPTPRRRSHQPRSDQYAVNDQGTRNRIIPPDEDMRRLFQECKIAIGNASLLESALAHADVDNAKEDDIVKEFYLKCRTSQELIYAQIPWASAQSEKSRVTRDLEIKKQMSEGGISFVVDPSEETQEEKLLAAILQANGDLIEVLKQYDDIGRLRAENKRKQQHTRPRQMPPQHISTNGTPRDPSPSPPVLHVHPPHHHQHQQPVHHGQPLSPSPSISSDLSHSQTQYFPEYPQHQQQQQQQPPLPPPPPSSQQRQLFGPRSVPLAPLGPRPSVETEREVNREPSFTTGSGPDEYIWVPPPGHYTNRSARSSLSESSNSERRTSRQYQQRQQPQPPQQQPQPQQQQQQQQQREVEVEEEYSENPPAVMSEKAKGKMKASNSLRSGAPPVHPPQGTGANQYEMEDGVAGDGEGVYMNGNTQLNGSTHSFESIPPSLLKHSSDSEDDDLDLGGAGGTGAGGMGDINGKKKKIQYVYDAAAERTKERLKSMGLENVAVD